MASEPWKITAIHLEGESEPLTIDKRSTVCEFRIPVVSPREPLDASEWSETTHELRIPPVVVVRLRQKGTITVYAPQAIRYVVWSQ